MVVITKTCIICDAEFLIDERFVKYDTKHQRSRGKYCSVLCSYKGRTIRVVSNCASCGNEVDRDPDQIRKSKSGNAFCNNSCAATYNNRNKTTGNRRSKLEAYIEQRIRDTHPDLELIVNGKAAVGQELDFYFPTLGIALEINGIFHYKPIYGEEKLKRIQANDESKLKACLDRNIRLIVHNDNATRYTVKTAELQWETIRPLLNIVPHVRVELTTRGV